MKNIDLHITSQRLQKWNACDGQYKLFVRCFPDGITLTRELLLKHAPDFELQWLASKLLSAEQLAAYDEATAPAQAALDKACDTAWADYDNVYAPARAALATAWADYDNVYATALADALSLP